MLILLAHGAEPRAKALHERFNERGCESGREDDAEGLGSYEYIKYAQYTPLYYACKSGCSDIVVDLLMHNTEPLKQMIDGTLPLMHGSADMTGGDRNGGGSQYWFAVKEIVKLLIMYNADFSSCVRILASPTFSAFVPSSF